MSADYLASNGVPLRASCEERRILFAGSSVPGSSRAPPTMRQASRRFGGSGGGGGAAIHSSEQLGITTTTHTKKSCSLRRRPPNSTAYPASLSPADDHSRAHRAWVGRNRGTTTTTTTTTGNSNSGRRMFSGSIVVAADRAGVLFGYRGATLRALKAEKPNVKIDVSGEFGGDQTVQVSGECKVEVESVIDAVRSGWRPWASRWGWSKPQRPAAERCWRRG